MSRRKRGNDRAEDVLTGADDNTPEAVANDIFGASAPNLDTLRVVARPTSLNKIWFDRRQPRRLIPARIAGRWDGDPAGVDELVGRWIDEARKRLDRDERLDVGAILRGDDYLDLDKEDQPMVVASLVELVELAIGIRNDGLTNPPTAAKRGGGTWLLHTGERRTMAHHLLCMAHVGTPRADDWLKLPVIETEHSVWTQVSENTQRSDMTAVGYARALASLYFDMWQGEKEIADYFELLADNGCDRAYYAQALELNAKKGEGDKLMTALNATSRQRVSQYRKVLELPDEAWTRADEEGWSERLIREFLGMPEHMQKTAIENGWTEDLIRKFAANADELRRESEARSNAAMSTMVDNSTPAAPERSQGEGRFGRDENAGIPAQSSQGGTEGSPHEALPPEQRPPVDEEGRIITTYKLPGQRKAGREENSYSVGSSSGERPTLTWQSSDADWELYENAPHPSEFEIGETWDEEDERIAAQVAVNNAAFDAEFAADEAHIADEEMATVLDALHTLALAVRKRETAHEIKMMRVRSRISIRASVGAAGGLDKYVDGLHAEMEQIESVFVQAAKMVEDYQGATASLAQEMSS